MSSCDEAAHTVQPVVEHLVLQHVVVGHWLAQLVDTLQEEVPCLLRCLEGGEKQACFEQQLGRPCFNTQVPR